MKQAGSINRTKHKHETDRVSINRNKQKTDRFN